jgi:hypothetical protein
MAEATSPAWAVVGMASSCWKSNLSPTKPLSAES